MDSFRIHPAIGIARVGNSEDYVISPETMAGTPAGPVLSGGLPIRPGTETDPVRSSDLRDSSGALKRHAARFRVFAYPAGDGPEAYPRGDGTEIVIGSAVDGKRVAAILWTVHLANKKANTFVLSEDPSTGPQGIAGYENGNLPPIRNVGFPVAGASQPPDGEKISTLNESVRTAALIIDPGPRAIAGAGQGPVRFDQSTAASYFEGPAPAIAIADYPKSFPSGSFPTRYEPSGPIDTLGELLTDEQGRLLVLGGHGKAVSWEVDGQPGNVESDVNNDQWFDDCSDGPVSALLQFDDGSTASVAGAWVTATDPSFAPQVRNIVTLWEDMYDAWVRAPALALAPQIYDVGAGSFRTSYQPGFNDQVAPIFQAASLQQWSVNLNGIGISAHRAVGQTTAADPPGPTGIFPVLRNPDKPDQQTRQYMPLHLGDANHSFLSLRDTQYFFVSQWNAGQYVSATATQPGPGEYLDMAVLGNCLGGRFSPGIDLTFVMREPSIYVQGWQGSGTGPFRVNPKALDYGQASAGAPLLTGGYVPRQNPADEIEPGDLSKFMAIPWHTDYNSCATHPPSPNPPGNNRVFWSWPAQRPVAVYVAADVAGASPSLPDQRWSVRGPGTMATDAEDWGRYQDAHLMLTNWNQIGIVLQAPQIDGLDPSAPTNWYLEAESQLEDSDSNPVEPYPNITKGG